MAKTLSKMQTNPKIPINKSHKTNPNNNSYNNSNLNKKTLNNPSPKTNYKKLSPNTQVKPSMISTSH